MASSVGEPCTFHDLRHSSAALLIQAGQHAKVIQERLGHSSIKTTLDVYGHLFPGMDEAAAEALDEMARGVGVGLGRAEATSRSLAFMFVPEQLVAQLLRVLKVFVWPTIKTFSLFSVSIES